jgi:hypothetical protein
MLSPAVSDRSIRGEHEGADEHYKLLDTITQEKPELRNPVFSETFSKLLPYSEKSHAEYYTITMDLYGNIRETRKYPIG